jgi:hypothetical protein
MINANSLRVVSPIATTDAMLTSSSIAETDYTAWDNFTAYSAGTRVRRVTTNIHRVYECIQAHTGRDPLTLANETHWALVGPTNRWAMFDLRSGTLSTASTSIDVQIAPGLIDSLALVEITAVSARVRMTDTPHGTFYDRTFTLIERDVTNYTDWFFAPFKQRKTLLLTDLPRVSGATVRVTLTSGGTVSLGALLVGRSTVIGDVMARARVQVVDYSRKDVDQFGQTTIVERPSARSMNLEVLVASSRADEVIDALDELRNKISFFAVGSETGYRSLQILGWPEFDASINGPTFTTIAGKIQGIT